jgi:chemosensory pili system protein ChpC
MSATEPAELYSLLIPIHGERLLVPRLCVAEVVSYTEPNPPAEDDPDWFLGHVGWNGRELPVVSFETLFSGEAPQTRGRTRIVVFHALNSELKHGYFGLLTQGFPQLVRVNRDVLSVEADSQFDADSPAHCRVRMINEYPLIPNLEGLETRIASR